LRVADALEDRLRFGQIRQSQIHRLHSTCEASLEDPRAEALIAAKGQPEGADADSER